MRLHACSALEHKDALKVLSAHIHKDLETIVMVILTSRVQRIKKQVWGVLFGVRAIHLDVADD